MKRKIKIDPKVDCVFKAILGSEKNKNLLIHFLNAVLETKKDEIIQDVIIKNPYNEKDFIRDKLSIVDVKAIDEKGKHFQVEIQLALHSALKSRILYTWSSMYHSQIQEGDDYKNLKPVISIWILNARLFEKTKVCHIPFCVYSPGNSLTLTDQLAIHILQLPEWKLEKGVKSEKDRWIYLFKEGGNTDPENPPDELKTKEMRQVMKVMNRFAENEQDYLLYQSRLDAILEKNTWLSDLEEARREKEEAIQKLMIAEKEKAEKDAQIHALQKLLKDKGIIS